MVTENVKRDRFEGRRHSVNELKMSGGKKTKKPADSARLPISRGREGEQAGCRKQRS